MMFCSFYNLLVFVVMLDIAQASENDSYPTSSMSEGQNEKATYNYITTVTTSLPRSMGQDSLREIDDEEDKTLASSGETSFETADTLIKPYWEELLYYKTTQRYLGQFLRDLKLFCEKEGILFRNQDYDYKKFTNIEKFYSTKLKIYELLSQTENYLLNSLNPEKIIDEHVSVLNGLRIIVTDTDRWVTSCRREDWLTSLKVLDSTIIIIENLAGFYKNHADLMARIYIHEIKQLSKFPSPVPLKEETLNHDMALELMLSRQGVLMELAADLHLERKNAETKPLSPRTSLTSFSSFLHIPFYSRTSSESSLSTSPRKNKEHKKEEKTKQREKSKPKLRKSVTELNLNYVLGKENEGVD